MSITAAGSTATAGTATAEMTALFMEAPGKVVPRRLPVPSARPGHAVVAVRYLGLCATDLGFYDGSSNYLHDGQKSFPFVFGHEWSGQVVAVGEPSGTGGGAAGASGAVTVRVGDRVAGHNFRPCGTCDICLRGLSMHCPDRSEIGVLGPAPGAAAEYVEVPVDTVTVIPGGISDRAATLLEPCSAALHAVNRIGICAEDRVAVLGGGTLGLAAAQIARARGAEVHLLDPGVHPRALAAELGLEHAMDPSAARHGHYTAVIEASGAEAAIRLAPLLCTPGARIAQLGTPHEPVDGFPTAVLVINNVVLHAVLSGVDQWAGLVELVESGALRLEPLIDRVVPVDDIDKAFAALAEGGRRRPKVLVQLSKGEK
ncbi:zinc-dependent alcohol dehydrogenase [Streptomyces sp. SP18CS02]|uniref:zinc-dependent alcohol dehydrogenase n=1 Tax=Streptomyces sp. SP18CS02 TaxID=3002531 RepID=UPI002E784600|nr:alcohol dehydrogenase catalytic domain-containing protein [Streptomyces sp. SP18CS02]MEE1756448.1 alcohol dehydrogenase catalytic domain-containing protein [Streptomyces sp. SP18CS02]